MPTNAHEILKQYVTMLEDKTFEELGLDSLDIHEFISEVESVYQIDLLDFKLEKDHTLKQVLDEISRQKTSTYETPHNYIQFEW